MPRPPPPPSGRGEGGGDKYEAIVGGGEGVLGEMGTVSTGCM